MLASAAVLIALAAAPAATTPEAPTVGAVAKGILDPRVPGVLETWRARIMRDWPGRP